MTATFNKKATKIDKIICDIVAKKGKGHTVYEEIVDDLTENLTRTKTKRIITGNSEPTIDEAKKILSVLRKYDEAITLESII